MIGKKLLVVLFLTSVLNVNTERGFDIIRHNRYGINYLQYIGLIPSHIKCLKWGYKRTNFDLFKLEIVCLQQLEEHAGTCPLWQDCHWYHYYNYFPITCLRDTDCDSTCKCCYSPCFGTLTCRPAIVRQIDSASSGTTRDTTTMMIGTTEMRTHVNQAEFVTTTTEAVDSKEDDVPNEVDYNSVLVEAGPNVLHESEYEDSSQEPNNERVDEKSDDAPAQNGRVRAKVTTTEPGAIRTTVTSPLVGVIAHGSSSSTVDDDDELLGSGSGGTDDRFHFDLYVFTTDDEDMVREGSTGGK